MAARVEELSALSIQPPYPGGSFSREHLPPPVCEAAPRVPFLEALSGTLSRGSELVLPANRAQLDASAGVLHTENSEIMTFKNPLLSDGQDPWVTQADGDYLLCHTDSALGWTPVSIRRSRTVTGLRDAKSVVVWTPPKIGEASTDIWAPELRDLRRRWGKWFIHVAAWSGIQGEPHEMFALESNTENPEEGFFMKGKVKLPTPWGIDATIIENGDELFCVWSAKEEIKGFDPQYLYIFAMENPWTLTGPEVCISRPQYPWEMTYPHPVNEGPQELRRAKERDGITRLIFSAGSTTTDEYCMGMLVNKSGDLLDPAAWEKVPEPVFYGTEEVLSPGHGSFVTSPDGTEDWMFFHSAKYSGAGLNRQVHAQPFTWNEDGSPNFGRPISTGEPIPVPSGEEEIYLEQEERREQAERERHEVPNIYFIRQPDLPELVDTVAD